MNVPNAVTIRVSDRAQARIRSLKGRASSRAAPTVRLFAERTAEGRVEVALGFDAPGEEDEVLRLQGLTLVLDPETRALCRKTDIDIDYEDGEDRRGFLIRRVEHDAIAGVAKADILPNSSC